MVKERHYRRRRLRWPKPGRTQSKQQTEADRHLRAAMRVYMLRKQELAQLAMQGLCVSSIVTPEKKTDGGILIACTSIVWAEIVKRLRDDWTLAQSIPPHVWEEIIAGAFKKAGFDEVTLTPRSGDHGRDVIAVRHGIGSVKIIDSVKAYSPGHLVEYEHVRALLGVLSGERDASKGVISTTSGFPPKIADDPFIAPFLPTRLELMDGKALQKWLSDLAQ